MNTSTAKPRTRTPRPPNMASQTHRVMKIQGTPSSPVKPRKRKATTQTGPPPDAEAIDLADDAPTSAKKPRSQRRQSQNSPKNNERRARRWRKGPPQSYLERLERIRRTRMYVSGHTVGGTEEYPEFSFDIVGSTGNIYKVLIGKEPVCDCPDGRKGNQCKHICYVLVHAFKAAAHLQYQLAFLSSELREMYQDSPLSRIEDINAEDNNGKRKPVDGDCPVCFMEFEPKENIIWCKAACGNNIHKKCFEQWAATTSNKGVRCVYCRTPWDYEDNDNDVDIQALKTSGKRNHEGYVNVAQQFGLSGERDFSVYSPRSTVRWSSSSAQRGAFNQY